MVICSRYVILKEQKELQVCVKDLSLVKGGGSGEDLAEPQLASTSLLLDRMTACRALQ